GARRERRSRPHVVQASEKPGESPIVTSVAVLSAHALPSANTEDHAMSPSKRAIALVIAALAVPVLAQSLYKSIMPDGRVIYGDKPVPGAVKVEAPRVDPAAKGITPPSSAESATLKYLENDRKGREAGSDALRQAEQAVKDAEAKAAAGKEPQEGER